jgi:hypothetical protein
MVLRDAAFRSAARRGLDARRGSVLQGVRCRRPRLVALGHGCIRVDYSAASTAQMLGGSRCAL